jgi:hypothetical protein
MMPIEKVPLRIKFFQINLSDCLCDGEFKGEMKRRTYEQVLFSPATDNDFNISGNLLIHLLK